MNRADARIRPADDAYYRQPRLDFGTHFDMLRDAGVPSRGRALDIGCGEGHFGRLLLAAGFDEVTGVEPHPSAADRARTRLTTVVTAPFPNTDVEAMRPYDLVVFSDSLEHIADPWLALDKASGLMARGGHLLVCVPNVSHYSVLRQQLRGRWDYTNEGLLDRGHLRFFTAATLRTALVDAGFRVICTHQLTSVPQRSWMKPGVSLLQRWKPHLFWYASLAVARLE